MNHLGIDVGRKTSAVRCLGPKGATLLHSSINNSPLELEQLLKSLAEKGKVRVYLETGNCSFIMARTAKTAGAEVYVVDALQNALIRESLKKDDDFDAFQLADQGRRGLYPKIGVYVPSEAEEKLRRLVAYRADLVRQQTATNNKAVRLCDRHGIYLEKGKLLTAKTWKRLTVDSSGWDDLDCKMLFHYGGLLELLKLRIKEADSQLVSSSRAYSSKSYEVLNTIPGFGPVTIAAFIAQTGDLKRFPNGRAVARYVGLTPVKRQSGKKGGLGKICKAGNARLRGYLLNAAEAFSKYAGEDDTLRIWYQETMSRRGWYKARVALARRLTACAYAMMKNGTPYMQRPH